MYISISVKNLEATCVVNGAMFCSVVRDKEDKKGSAFLYILVVILWVSFLYLFVSLALIYLLTSLYITNLVNNQV